LVFDRLRHRSAARDLHFRNANTPQNNGQIVTETADFVDRRHERAELEDGGDLTIVVRRSTENGPDEELTANALDVSSSGMKLITTAPLVFAEPIALHFHSQSLQIDFVIDAEVRWIRQGNDEAAWLVGCAFAAQLSADGLDQLAVAGGLDRRQWPRNHTEIHTTVQLACSRTPFDATLLDYSSAGLCFSSTEAVQPSDPVRLQLFDDDNELFEVMAKCRWKLSFESGYLIGCEVGGQDRSEFENWSGGHTSEEAKPSNSRKRLGILGCVVIGALLTLVWLMNW
jgi:hypothetical protein